MRSNVLFFGVALVLVSLLAGCTNSVVCNKPYIQVGSACCLDANDNSICDSDEPSTTTTTVTTTTTTTRSTTTTSTTTTSRPTTTTSTTTSTTTTTKPVSPYLSSCGQPFCIYMDHVKNTCAAYDVIRQVCADAKSYVLCNNLSMVYNCSKESYCFESITGAGCKQKQGGSVPNNMAPNYKGVDTE